MLKGPFKELDMTAQVTGGICPTCTHETMLVSLTPELFRCVNCGADCKQYINGKIRYLPALSISKKSDVQAPKMGG
jgi:hypothetical protein